MNLQLASTEEWIEGKFAGNLGEVLIRWVWSVGYCSEHYNNESVDCLTNISIARGVAGGIVIILGVFFLIVGA
jgi:hypothetical protein